MNKKNANQSDRGFSGETDRTYFMVRTAEYGKCPYLSGRSWSVLETEPYALSPDLYEATLPLGWRRSGAMFYKTACRGCNMCVPIRLDSLDWKPSASQKRLAAPNADISVKITEAGFTEERFNLYRRYQTYKHDSRFLDQALEMKAYQAAYCTGFPASIHPGVTGVSGCTAVTEYRLIASGRLVATGYIDILPNGISSVYFAFEPDMHKRSPGTWSVGRELALAAELGKRFYYLGFWVPGSPKMDYKSKFRPFEMAPRGTWIRAEDRESALGMLADIPGAVDIPKRSGLDSTIGTLGPGPVSHLPKNRTEGFSG